MRWLITIFLITCCMILHAQKERNNWYFGAYAAMSFDGGPARAKYDNPNKFEGHSVSISDPVTGQLLFYSDGQTVWNSQHQIMDNGSNLSSRGSVIAFPFPGSRNKYYLFFISENNVLQYVTIDMSQNNGSGAVVTGAIDVSPNNMRAFVAIRHQYQDAYWVVAHEKSSNRFKAYLVDESGIHTQPAISEIGLQVDQYGMITLGTSNKGNRLVIADIFGYKIQIFDFDRACGVLSRPVELSPAPGDRTMGIAFSPDDSKLYISYASSPQNVLVQYSGTDFGARYVVASDKGSFNSLRLGPDNSIYISNEEFGTLEDRIDVILDPNQSAGACKFKKYFLSLEDATNTGRLPDFGFPTFVTGQKLTTPIRDSIFNYTGSCAGYPVQFLFNISNPYDSLLWTFGDNSPEQSRTVDPVHIYKASGKYPVTLTIFRCGKAFLLTDTAFIDNFPVIGFPDDTTVCIAQAVALTGPPAQNYQWSTGESTRGLLQKDPGLTWLKASNGNCRNTDSTTIAYYPEVMTRLGSEYFLCEEDDELVKLDAGEGFMYYQWMPTGDTLHWIIVKNTGDYFVKVTDNHGCIGNDETRVKRVCGVLIHFPNAFTPNNDGVNDIFKPSGMDVLAFRMHIYNRWGELVFTSNSLSSGWDGTYKGQLSPDGTYTYVTEYTGYQQKRKHTFHRKGDFTLFH